jgi:hypothetical protein
VSGGLVAVADPPPLGMVNLDFLLLLLHVAVVC